MKNNWSEYFTADFEKGILKWKERPRSHFNSDIGHNGTNSRFGGTVAGSARTDGYVRIKINYSVVYAHRVLWEMRSGPIPSGYVIDHIDGNPMNNAMSNLRLATNAENMQNRGKNKNNTSGHKGVSWHSESNKWRARVMKSGIEVNLGVFDSINEAVEAHRISTIKLHRDFAKTH